MGLLPFGGAPLLWSIGAASAVVLIAGAIVCGEDNCTSYEAWAVSAGTVSLFVALVLSILMIFRKGELVEKVSPFVSTFLMLWWIPGAFVTTFKAPFVLVGNGYFGSWAAFLFSVAYFQNSGLGLFLHKDVDVASPTPATPRV